MRHLMSPWAKKTKNRSDGAGKKENTDRTDRILTNDALFIFVLVSKLVVEKLFSYFLIVGQHIRLHVIRIELVHV